ncbi:MAG: hypothetical protein AAB649_00645 [Patescibacteria group bacterium]
MKTLTLRELREQIRKSINEAYPMPREPGAEGEYIMPDTAANIMKAVNRYAQDYYESPDGAKWQREAVISLLKRITRTR